MTARRLPLFRFVALAGAGLVAAEWVGCRAAREQRRRARVPAATTAVIVLGYGNPEPTANAINRRRVDAALAACTQLTGEITLVLCGGTVASDVPEAVHLERYVRDGRHADHRILRDDTSKTTWQNIRNAIPLVDQADRIVIVSDPRHAALARVDLWLQRPDLAQRLARLDAPQPAETIVALALAAGALVKNRIWRR